METPISDFSPETESLLQQYGGPISLTGQQGQYVVMRSDVYQAMLGLESNEEAETLASIRRGIADVQAGRTHEIDAAFQKLKSRYGS